MVQHELSAEDRRFRAEFESGETAPGGFDHRLHIRLAYVYLAENDDETATTMMRDALLGYLRHHRIDVTKYHETITQAWILAVRHFMQKSDAAPCADAFIDANPVMLDAKIMLSHYSAQLLFSDEARARFVEPDLDEIPRHDS